MTLSSLNLCLRPEHPGDAEPIRHVNVLAFDGPIEADLVESLRSADATTLSAVALLDATRVGKTGLSPEELAMLYTGETYGGELVGHVLFTPATIETGKERIPLLALDPVTVLPAEQRKGIGTMMISGCLEYLRTRHHIGVVTAGEQAFFRRFGFIEAKRWGLKNELGVPEENFLALELTPGSLGGNSGLVRYRTEFGSLHYSQRDRDQS